MSIIEYFMDVCSICFYRLTLPESVLESAYWFDVTHQIVQHECKRTGESIEELEAAYETSDFYIDPFGDPLAGRESFHDKIAFSWSHSDAENDRRSEERLALDAENGVTPSMILNRRMLLFIQSRRREDSPDFKPDLNLAPQLG